MTHHDDERFYELVVAELKEGQRREGLWAKALTEAVGDEQVAQSLYMKWRVDQLVEAATEEEAKRVKQAREKEKQSRQMRTDAFWNTILNLVFGVLAFLMVVAITLMCVVWMNP